jgi:PleD family two-component response regulator
LPFIQDSEEPEELIMRADAAMYHAKRHGKNRFGFFQPEMA